MISPKLTIQEVAFQSPLQVASTLLRSEVLRKPLGLTFSEEELAGESNQVHLVATILEDVVGVLLLVPLQNQEWKMRQVAVSPDLQGQGIGQQMVLFAEQWLKNRDALQVVLHARLKAVPFYKKLNYHTDEVVFTEVGIPHFKMWKEFH